MLIKELVEQIEQKTHTDIVTSYDQDSLDDIVTALKNVDLEKPIKYYKLDTNIAIIDLLDKLHAVYIPEGEDKVLSDTAIIADGILIVTEYKA